MKNLKKSRAKLQSIGGNAILKADLLFRLGSVREKK